MIFCDISVQCVLKLDLSFLHDYIVHTVGYPHAKYQRPNPFCIEMSGVLKIGIGEGNRGALGAHAPHILWTGGTGGMHVATNAFK